ncbi:MAG: glycosyltransferase family 4 protein [Thermodesulfobacteriota bacterium]
MPYTQLKRTEPGPVTSSPRPAPTSPPARDGQREHLRIGLLSYRSNPHCGGQGIYVKNLSKALADLGHQVQVISGEPYPELDPRVELVPLPGLNLYSYPTARGAVRERGLRSLTDLHEYLSFISGGFPEPYCFGRRLQGLLQSKLQDLDILHDNQSLCYGLLGLQKAGFPVLATLHHPISMDLKYALAQEENWGMRLLIRRWHSFLGMQQKVASRLQGLLAVSQSSKQDFQREFGLRTEKIQVVHNGVDLQSFCPRPDIQLRPGRIMATASADVPLKGLSYLLKALHSLSREFPHLHLVVLGRPKGNGPTARLLDQLGIRDRVRFVHGLSEEQIALEYAKSSLAVVPSLYEGFGLPAAEAMACAKPLISSTGGALPEVVGESGLLVPPADSKALAAAIKRLLQSPELAWELGQAGRSRMEKHFSWKKAAERTVDIYRQTLYPALDHAHF